LLITFEDEIHLPPLFGRVGGQVGSRARKESRIRAALAARVATETALPHIALA